VDIASIALFCAGLMVGLLVAVANIDQMTVKQESSHRFVHVAPGLPASG